MCFSAAASFASSGVLVVVGIATLRIASKKQLYIAAIPLLFAIQQALEGFQWLAIGSGCETVSTIAKYGFILFALLLWPVYIPMAVYALDKKTRHINRWFIGLGTLLSLYFLSLLFLGPIQVQVMELGIYYKIGMLFGVVTGTLYFIAICGALLSSSIREARMFGVAMFVCVAFTTLFFRLTFTSTWCFFAALLSSLIYFYIRDTQKSI